MIHFTAKLQLKIFTRTPVLRKDYCKEFLTTRLLLTFNNKTVAKNNKNSGFIHDYNQLANVTSRSIVYSIMLHLVQDSVNMKVE